MAIKVYSCLPLGLEGKLIEVEVDISQGMAAFNIVGLGDTAVQESKERIRSAIKNCGISYPQQKKTINLAPANLKKHGPLFDLPMALGIIAASGLIAPAPFHETLIVGELALDGKIRPVNGIITIAIFAKKNGWKQVIIPAQNLSEAELVKGVEFIPASSLSQIVGFLNGEKPSEFSADPNCQICYGERPDCKSCHTKKAAENASVPVPTEGAYVDFADIKGQELAKRALLISAAGGHHLLLHGPPGIGKTMLARAIPGILPPLDEQEKMEVMQIYSCAGMFSEISSSDSRPFRAVHPSCTLLSLTGGGNNPRPGEITLAHNGILFMDEIAEFSRAHLEVLRQPLEDREIHLSRVMNTVTYPAGFTLVAGMNPCPCGFFGDRKIECKCKPFQIQNYRKKISGPIMDRIDIYVDMEREKTKYLDNISGTPSIEIRQTVFGARVAQLDRFGNTTKLNSSMTSAEVKKLINLTPTAAGMMDEAMEKLELSGRAFHKILKVARTIADLERNPEVNTEHLAEALQYRHKEQRNY